MEQKKLDQLMKVAKTRIPFRLSQAISLFGIAVSVFIMLAGYWFDESYLLLVGVLLTMLSNLYTVSARNEANIALLSGAFLELLEKEKTTETLNE